MLQLSWQAANRRCEHIDIEGQVSTHFTTVREARNLATRSSVAMVKCFDCVGARCKATHLWTALPYNWQPALMLAIVFCGFTLTILNLS